MRNGYGICRGDELFAMFVLGRQPPPMNSGPFSEFDKKNSQKLLTLWTDFAKYGNPNDQNCTQNCFDWQPLNATKRMAYLKTGGYVMSSDDLYWKRIKVFANVQHLLNTNGNEDLQLQKIQALLQSNLWNPKESLAKEDL